MQVVNFWVQNILYFANASLKKIEGTINLLNNLTNVDVV